MTDVVEVMARAMERRAREPVANLRSLEPVLVGSMGDAWPYLIRAALAALEGARFAVVPVDRLLNVAAIWDGGDRLSEINDMLSAYKQAST